MVQSISKVKDKYMGFYQRHEALISIVFFALGFLIDILTFKRVYSLNGIILQGLYLFILGVLLTLEIRKMSGRFKLSQNSEKIWGYHNLVVHFLFGSLLSLYTIFYYTSASAFTSFLFILLLAGLMLANELSSIRAIGLPVRTILYTICTLSYFSFLYPTILGRIGEFPFWLGIGSSFSLLSLIWILNFRGISRLRKKVLYPSIIVHLFFLFAYYTSLIPPVPVAVKKIGVYYDVLKADGKYIGKHNREFWAKWNFGPEPFLVRPGDKVAIFVSIFSPARFQDQVYLKWFYDDESKGWVLEDTIPLNIVGGREEGFRGFGIKQFYKLGIWRVIVETSDGREVGRITLNIMNDASTNERFFQNDIY